MPRRLSLLAVLAVAVFWSSVAVDAGRQGVHLTRNGYRAPIFGVSQRHDANGMASTSCGHITAEQIEPLRFGRHASRAQLASSPHVVVRGAEGGAAFDITYSDSPGTGFNDGAQGEARRRALEAAAAAWAKVLQGTITIKVDAVMEEIDDGDEDDSTMLLATAGPVDFWIREGNAIPSALMWQLINRRDNDGDADIQVNANTEADWDYSVNGVAPRGKTSFVYTLIHEIGHGLGFIDSFDPETGTLMNDPTPFIYDTFVNRRSDTRRLVMNRPPHEVKDDLRSQELFFNGDAANDASRRSIKPGPMIRLYAPDPYEAGSSVSHVDQETYADVRTGTMAPRDFGSGTDKIDILTLGIMKDLGYRLVPNATTARIQH
jgi:hypothetical protein